MLQTKTKSVGKQAKKLQVTWIGVNFIEIFVISYCLLELKAHDEVADVADKDQVISGKIGQEAAGDMKWCKFLVHLEIFVISYFC